MAVAALTAIHMHVLRTFRHLKKKLHNSFTLAREELMHLCEVSSESRSFFRNHRRDMLELNLA